MSTRGTPFVGFGIRIDILAQGALFAFQQLSIKAALLAGAISQLTIEFYEFEKAMSDVERMLIISAGSMESFASTSMEVQQAIISFAANSVYSINEVSEAFTYLMRAGFDARESIAALNDVITLAFAANMELVTAAETLTKVWYNWASAGYEMTNIVDKLVKSEQMFNATTEDMLMALSNVGASAAQAGLTFEQTVVMLGLLMRGLKNASAAGTTLRRTLVEIIQPSNEAREVMQQYGIDLQAFDTSDVITRLKMVAEVLLSIQDPTERASVAITIFGARAWENTQLLNGLISSFDEFNNQLMDSAGIATMVADNLKNNLAIAFDILVGKIEAGIGSFALWIQEGNNFVTAAGIMGGAIVALIYRQQMLAIASKFSLIWLWKLAKAIFLNTIHFKKFAISTWQSAVALIVQAKAAFITFMQTKLLNKEFYKTIIANIWGAITTINWSVIWGIFTASMRAAAQATRSFMAALGPIAIIGMLVAGVIKYIMENTNLMSSVMDAIRPILNSFAEVWSVLNELFDAFFQLLKPILDLIMTILLPVIKMFMMPLTIIIRLVTLMIRPFTGLFKILGGVFQAMMKGVMGGKLMVKIMKWVGVAISWVEKGLDAIINGIIFLINKVIDLVNLIPGINISHLKTTQEMREEREREKLEEERQKEQESPFTTTAGEIPEISQPATGEGLPGAPPATEGTTTGRTGGGGRAAGAVNITIYITAEIDEMFNAEAFGEAVAKQAIAEMKRIRGVNVI